MSTSTLHTFDIVRHLTRLRSDNMTLFGKVGDGLCITEEEESTAQKVLTAIFNNCVDQAANAKADAGLKLQVPISSSEPTIVDSPASQVFALDDHVSRLTQAVEMEQNMQQEDWKGSLSFLRV